MIISTVSDHVTIGDIAGYTPSIILMCKLNWLDLPVLCESIPASIDLYY